MIQQRIAYLGDAPSLKSGLGRITRDLSALTAQLPEYRVACIGRGGIYSSQIGLPQYLFPESHGFGNDTLMEYVDADFAHGKPLIVCAIWDPARLLWLSRGEWYRKNQHRVRLWAYVPVDSASINGRLMRSEIAALEPFERVLAYGEFGARVLSASLGREIDWLPHGMSTDVFQPRDRQAARVALGMSVRDKVVGCVMTNQIRKDWNCAIAALAMLPGWKMWAHVDVLERHWSLLNLIEEYGVADRIKVTLSGELNDTELSYHYSACDVSILPSAEGYGYPIAESLACGTPVIHTKYGGGVWDEMPVVYVPPNNLRIEGLFNSARPVLDPNGWADAITGNLPIAEECRAAVAHLDWKLLWPGRWKKWIMAGVQ